MPVDGDADDLDARRGQNARAPAVTRILDTHTDRAGGAEDRAEHEKRMGRAAEDARPVRVSQDTARAGEEWCEPAPKPDCSERVAVGEVGVGGAGERAPAAAQPV